MNNALFVELAQYFYLKDCPLRLQDSKYSMLEQCDYSSEEFKEWIVNMWKHEIYSYIAHIRLLDDIQPRLMIYHFKKPPITVFE
ncbi:hypothetical protein PB01_15585 [Psychrobacillus glaciei]|uniref:Uncharacterized protein n=1 Tax=Psychrobacillus glaciei TaxID=2283160 RepID=A0A5J6STA1_9BACI|nr:hypothetical protein PB01_15585 [Psychrobacillus glaciei]